MLIRAQINTSIRNYADTLPAKTAKELSKFRQEIEVNYRELFNFPVINAPKEKQVDYEISVFEYLDECLGMCFKTYNMYCNAGLQEPTV